MMRHVPNTELRLENIPAPEAGWEAHADFAHSFFGYDQMGGALTALASAASTRYRQEGALPATLTELRACLFFEHRRAVHFGAPTDKMRVYAKALLAAIREKVEQGALE
jgi:hypothetical protein